MRYQRFYYIVFTVRHTNWVRRYLRFYCYLRSIRAVAISFTDTRHPRVRRWSCYFDDVPTEPECPRRQRQHRREQGAEVSRPFRQVVDRGQE